MKSRLHAASFVWIRVHSWLNQRFLKKSIGGFSESVGALNHSFDARGAARPPPVPTGAAFGHINAHCPAPCGAGQAGCLSYCTVPMRPCPGGTVENSPAFQRRERATKRPRPEGTVEITVGIGRRFTGGSAAAPAAVGRALAPNRSASKHAQWSWKCHAQLWVAGRDPQRPRRARSPIPLHRSDLAGTVQSVPGGTGHRPVLGGNLPPSRTHDSLSASTRCDRGPVAVRAPDRTGRWPVPTGPVASRTGAWHASRTALPIRSNVHHWVTTLKNWHGAANWLVREMTAGSKGRSIWRVAPGCSTSTPERSS